MYLAEQFTHQAHHKTIIVATKVCKSRCRRLSPVRVYMYRRTLTNPTIVLFRLVNVYELVHVNVYELVKCILNGSSCNFGATSI